MPTRHPHPIRAAASCVLAAASVALLAGCDAEVEEGRRPVFRASGRVTHRGEAAEGARVMLHPTDPALAAAGLFPNGTTDASGRFTLTTYEQGDGAPAGAYRATVVWPVAGYTPKTREEREELLTGAQPPDRLKGRYARPERSGLAVTVRDGEPDQELPDLELK